MQKKLRIQELVSKTKDSIQSIGYQKPSISFHKSVWKAFEEYATARNAEYFSVAFGNEFLNKRYGITSFKNLSSTQRQYIRSIQMLNEVQLHGYILTRHSARNYAYPPEFKAIFEQFIDYRESIGIVPSSMLTTKLHLERFAEHLNYKGLKDFSKVNMEFVYSFMRSISVYGKATIDHTLRTIRHLFAWSFENGYMPKDLSSLVPRIRYQKFSKIPSAYTAAEVKQLLNVVDRENPIGKRDYVFLLFASRLGLRASDICGLKFENLKWETNRIELIQQKTGNILTIPLLEDIGLAIIDYLKHGRPLTDSKHIFVMHVPPYNAFKASSLYTVVSRYMNKAKIPAPQGKKRGPHALRHSLASSLLEENTPLPVISEILGHVDTNTTSVYLKIDIDKLRQCALEVPSYYPEEEAAMYANF